MTFVIALPRASWMVAGIALAGLVGCRPDVGGNTQAPPGASTQPPPIAERRPAGGEFTATAYSVEGKTALETPSRKGVVAADPDILPLGSRIRVEDAGRYSGEYSVEDTGRKIQGRKIDIYLPDDAEAKRFGRRKVRVEVLEVGVPRERDATRER